VLDRLRALSGSLTWRLKVLRHQPLVDPHLHDRHSQDQSEALLGKHGKSLSSYTYWLCSEDYQLLWLWNVEP
jgi:hypothetical protein